MRKTTHFRMAWLSVLMSIFLVTASLSQAKAQAGTNWTTQLTSYDLNWRSVTYGNGLYVMVASNGLGNRVMTSPDGINWTIRTSAADNQWRAVTYGNGLFVAVAATGTGNRVMTSPDGINWTIRTSAVDNPWISITYANNLFVAVAAIGTGNGVMTSPDGINWTTRTSAADNQWYSVTYGNGLFVATAISGTGNRVMTSSNGITWTARNSAADNQWTSVTYANGIFVAVAQSGTGNRVMTSPDGINWTARNSAADNQWTSVTYGNGLFVAVSSSGTGNRVMTSSNGINWTARTSAVDNQWASVTYANSLFVAVAQTGAGNRVMTSPDGITWTASNWLSLDNSWRSVTYGNGLFVAVSSSGTDNRVMTSPDGINWTARNAAANNSWYSVTYGNGLFVAVAATGTGNRVMTSPDGINWTARNAAVDNQWQSVTYGNGLFVAVAGGGISNRVMTSPDGINWTARNAAANNNWRSVAYGNGLFVAVALSGVGNHVMSSPDGINWTARTSAADNQWYSVTYGNGLFVAVASSGTGNRVMTSPDGINWTARTSAADNQWSSVTYGNGLFVAVAQTGSGNYVMTSPDGINWTARTSAADNQWLSVTYANGLFVAVAQTGSGNRVMTSGTFTPPCTSPSIGTQPQAQTVCAGTNLTLSVAATGDGLSYQWKKGAANVGTNANSLVLNNVSAADAANYSVEITGTCGNVTSSVVAVNVNATTAIGTQPQAQTVTEGANVTFTVAASGANLSYQWKKGAANVGTNSNSLVLNGVSVADADNYSVEITGDCGNVTSNSVALAVSTAGSTGNCTSPLLTIVNIGASMIDISWTPEPTNSLGYEVQWRAGTNPWNGPGRFVTSLAAYRIPSLVPNSTYTVRFRSICTSGINAWDNYTVTTEPLFTCNAPTVTVNNISASIVDISWGAEGNTAGYEVQWQTGTNPWTGPGKLASTTTSYRIPSLLPNTTYNYRVRSLCTPLKEWTLWTTSSFTTAATFSCNAPTPTLTHVGSTVVDVSWGLESNVAGYEIQWQTVGGFWTGPGRFAGNVTSYRIADLLPASTYNYRVRSLCFPLNEWTVWVMGSFTTKSSINCSSPTTISASATASAIDLSWTATDSTNAYEIQWQSVGGLWNGPGRINNPLLSAYRIPNLLSATTYNYRVRSRCLPTNEWAAWSTGNITTSSGGGRLGVSALAIHVYPNPSSGLVNVSGVEKASYAVFNTLGQQVLAGELNSENTALDLSNQANGMYLLKVVSDGAVQTKQVIINR